MAGLKGASTPPQVTAPGFGVDFVPMGRLLVAAGAAAALLHANAAAAAPLAERLEVRNDSCLVAETLASRIEHWATAPIAVHVHVRVTRRDGAVSFVIVGEGARDDEALGERSLHLPEGPCADVTDAVALAIATALDANPGGGGAASDAAPDKPATPETSVVTDRLDVDSSPTSTRPGARFRGPWSVSALVTTGVLARPAPGIEVGIDEAVNSWFDAQFLVFGVTETGSSTDEASGAHFAVLSSVIAAAVDGCAGRTSDGGRLRACLGVAAGVLISHVAQTNYAPPVYRGAPAVGWGGPTARLDARFALTPYLAVLVSVDGFAPWIRPHPQVVAAGFPAALDPAPAFGLGASSGLAFDL